MKNLIIFFSLLCSLLSFAQENDTHMAEFWQRDISKYRKNQESDLDRLIQSVIDCNQYVLVDMANPSQESGVVVKDGIASFPNGMKYPLKKQGVEFVSCKISKDERNVIFDSLLRILDADGNPYYVRLPLDPYHLKVYYDPNDTEEFHSNHCCKNLKTYKPSKSVALGDFFKVVSNASMCLICAKDPDFRIPVIFLPE